MAQVQPFVEALGHEIYGAERSIEQAAVELELVRQKYSAQIAEYEAAQDKLKDAKLFREFTRSMARMTLAGRRFSKDELAAAGAAFKKVSRRTGVYEEWELMGWCMKHRIDWFFKIDDKKVQAFVHANAVEIEDDYGDKAWMMPRHMSIPIRIDTKDDINISLPALKPVYQTEPRRFWFATGGAHNMRQTMREAFDRTLGDNPLEFLEVAEDERDLNDYIPF